MLPVLVSTIHSGSASAIFDNSFALYCLGSPGPVPILSLHAELEHEIVELLLREIGQQIGRRDHVRSGKTGAGSTSTKGLDHAERLITSQPNAARRGPIHRPTPEKFRAAG
jgi:hypothetical protein